MLFRLGVVFIRELGSMGMRSGVRVLVGYGFIFVVLFLRIWVLELSFRNFFCWVVGKGGSLREEGGCV